MFFRSFFRYKLFNLLFIILILNSCLTIEYDLTINNNKSGVLNITYTLDKSLKDISNLGDENSIIPLNLSENYILGLIGNRTDIKYKNYKIVESGELYIISVTFEFDTIEGLNSVLPIDNKITLLDDGTTITFSQNLITKQEGSINSQTMDIFKDIYKDNYFKLLVRTPRDIVTVNNGERLENRVAVYNKTFIELLTLSGDINWSVRW